MKGVGRTATASGTELDPPPRNAGLAALAARQHGVVSLTQLRNLGLSSSGVRNRVAAGSLHRVHRGVYAVGHPLISARGRWAAAVLAGGPRAVLSHRSAAALSEIRRTARRAIEITAPGRAGRRRPGIEIHRVRSLPASETTVVDAIPCTSVARTLLDLAEVVDPRSLERAFDRAEALGLLDVAAVEGVLERGVGRRGCAALRPLVADLRREAAITRSELEELFLALCASAGIPRPRVNYWIALEGGGAEADFAWPRQRLIAETDGRGTHGTRRAFEHDRRRDRRLMLVGWQVVRFTWRQLEREPWEVAEALRALLAARGAPPGGRSGRGAA